MPKKNADSQGSEPDGDPMKGEATPAIPPIQKRAGIEIPPDGRQDPMPLDPRAIAEFQAPKPRPEQLYAREFAEQIRGQQKARVAEVKRQDEAGKLFWLMCRCCQGVACIFKYNPAKSAITHLDWYSERKAYGQPWHGRKVPCMICGAPAPFLYLKSSNTIRPVPRFMRFSLQAKSETVEAG